MDLAQVEAGLFEKNSVEDSSDKQVERMELKDYAVDLRKVEDNHCSLEALVHPIGHHQIPYE